MKKLTWLGLILLALILLVGGAVGISKAIFGNRFDAEIAAIKAKGEPLTWNELLGTPIPALDNAAVIYDQIGRETATGNYKSDLEVVDEVVGLRGSPMDTATEEKLAKAVAHAGPLLDLTAEAVSKPRHQLYPDPATGQVDFKQFSTARNMCRLLSARSILHAKSGNTTAAADDVAMQFRLAAQLEGGSTLIAQLVRVALIAISCESLKDTVRYGRLSESQARQLYDALGSIDVAQGFRQSWLGERVHFLSVDPRAAGGVTPGGTGSLPFETLYANTVLKGDQAAYLGYIAKQLDGIGLSFREAKSRGLLDAPSFPTYAIISKILTPVFTRISFTRFRAEENVTRMQIFVALQAYKARYGGHPASMRELKSKLGWKLPVDPFSEKDFIYKRQTKGFILYSVGPDMKDDGGKALANNSVELDSKGDIGLMWDR